MQVKHTVETAKGDEPAASEAALTSKCCPFAGHLLCRASANPPRRGTLCLFLNLLHSLAICRAMSCPTRVLTSTSIIESRQLKRAPGHSSPKKVFFVRTRPLNFTRFGPQAKEGGLGASEAAVSSL